MVGRNKRCKELVYLLLFGGAWARAMVKKNIRGGKVIIPLVLDGRRGVINGYYAAI